MAVNNVDVVLESQPWPSPENLDTVRIPTQVVTMGTNGMASYDESKGELRREEGLC